MKDKIIERSRIKGLAEDLRAKKRRIVFTNGCFDLLHAGHVRYLEEAAGLGDDLMVGLNSDRSVRRIKDPRRPLITEEQRAEVLAALQCVHYVVLFEEADPYSLIAAVRPDVLVKGADWALEQIVGADLVLGYGGEVQRVRLVPAISTTEIIHRILDRYGKSGNPG
jgi:rfaE bifunctional protein nucleotidyltransferase chain/domain